MCFRTFQKHRASQKSLCTCATNVTSASFSYYGPTETCDTHIVQPPIPYAMSLHCVLVVTLILKRGGFIVCGVGAQWLLTGCTCNSFNSSLHRGPRTISASPSISRSQSKLRYSNRRIHHATGSNLQYCPSICVGRRETTSRMAGPLTKIWARDLANTKQERHTLGCDVWRNCTVQIRQ